MCIYTHIMYMCESYFSPPFFKKNIFLSAAQERRNWWMHSLECPLTGDIHSIRPLGARCQYVKHGLVASTTSPQPLSGTTQPVTTNPRQPPLPGKAAEHPSRPHLPRTPLRRMQGLQGPGTQTVIARLPNTKHGQELI